MKKLASLALAAGLFFSGPAVVTASPIDAVIGFYTSAVPNPPQIPVQVSQVNDLVTTGDIIIENDRAFAQWYVAIAALVPNTHFVHSGLVITGKDLLALNNRLKAIFRDDGFAEIKPHKLKLYTFANKKKKTITTWRWMPCEFDVNRKYVITPAGVGEKADNIVAVFDLHDYLVHPKYGSCKHIQVIRPDGLSEDGKNKIVDYLGLHLYKKTGYDMGFSMNEQENAEG
ncbi:MAG TPA: hypothetical protein PLM07_20245, partial [Candidatus Rifleibacterium sp.]|nr:hypothetical protein [Candidatus Rifleibacterium sp.]